MLGDPSIHQTSFTLEDVAAIRWRFLVLGLFNIALGVAAIILPKTTGYTIEVIIGLSLMFAGFADAWHAMLLRSRQGYMLSWVSSVLLVVVGTLILISPIIELTSLYLAIAVLFWLAGMLRIGKGMDIRPINNWPWVVASGMLMFLFGFYIMYKAEPISWPLMSFLVGISLVVDGWSRMILFWVHE